MTLQIGVIETGSSLRLGVSTGGGGESSVGWRSGTSSAFIDSTKCEASSLRILLSGPEPRVDSPADDLSRGFRVPTAHMQA